MKIITNTAMSLDGKIASVKNKHFYLGSAEDRRRMDLLRSQADAVLVGGKTFRNWSKPLASKKHKPLNIIVSRGFKILPEYVAPNLPVERLFFFSKYSGKKSEHVIKITGSSMPYFVVAALKKRRVKMLLIEAGGDMIYQFLKANLIDEMYVTLCPQIIGGKTAPSLVSGKGFNVSEFKKLQLKSVKKIGNEIYLHYKVSKENKR